MKLREIPVAPELIGRADGEDTMTAWQQVCGVDEIEQDSGRRFDFGGRTFAIFRSGSDEFFCTDGLCTHEAVHLADGLLMDYELECPKHAGVFDIRTGEAKRLPACVNLRTYPIRIDGGVVFAGLG